MISVLMLKAYKLIIKTIHYVNSSEYGPIPNVQTNNMFRTYSCFFFSSSQLLVVFFGVVSNTLCHFVEGTGAFLFCFFLFLFFSSLFNDSDFKLLTNVSHSKE